MLLLHEIPAAVRSLRQSPGFALAVILTLALGIGANGAIFSALHSVLLKPLPYPDSGQLVSIYNTYPKATATIYGTVSVPDFIDRQQQITLLEDSFLYRSSNHDLMLDSQPQKVRGYAVTADMFSTLQVQPALGQAFSVAHQQPGAHRVVIVSDAFWREVLQADDSVIGQPLRLNGESYQIIGVMPAGFAFPDDSARLWTPFTLSAEQRSDQERLDEYSSMLARLRPEATITQLNAQLDAVAARNLTRIGEGDIHEYLLNSGLVGRAEFWQQRLTEGLADQIWLLQGAVILVLLIACANIANLQLVRLSRRQREFALRLALGAARQRLMVHLFCESLLLAMAGAVLAVIFALAGIRLISGLGLELPASGLQAELGAAGLSYMLGAGLLAGFLAALLPVMMIGAASRYQRPAGTQRLVGADAVTGRLQRMLVAGQTALALALLIGAALLVRSFVNLQKSDPGFALDNNTVAYLSLPASRYPGTAEQIEFYQRLRQNLEQLPFTVGAASQIPLSGGDWNENYIIEGRPVQAGQAALGTHVRLADADYFNAMRIPLLQGRLFNQNDDHAAQPVALIDRYMAEQIFPGENPVGQRIRLTGNRASQPGWRTIVGVVDSVQHLNLHQPVSNETVYFPYAQESVGFLALVANTSTGSVDAAKVGAALRQAVSQVDPELPLYRISSLRELQRSSLVSQQSLTSLLSLFAAMSLLLAVLGIYAVLSFMVAQRRNEIGIRMAVGARAWTVILMVMRQGGRILLTGGLFGVVAALLLTRLLSSKLYGLPQVDVLSYLAVMLVLAVAGVAACWWPARRAARIQPTQALRYE